MTDRSEWLAQTLEAPLDPDIEICDAHHHLWDRGGQRYLVDEFIADTTGHRVTSSVYVECVSNYYETGPDALRPVGETAYVDHLTDACNTDDRQLAVAAAIVGFADLMLGAGVRDVLEAHLEASDRFRGIRHASAWDASELVHNAHTRPPEHLLADLAFREGFACLEQLDLSFDAWLYFHQIPELTDLARAFPETTIILNHVGGPIGVGPYEGRHAELFPLWCRYIRELATCENVRVKLGGLTMALAGFGWHKREIPAGSAELAEAFSPYFMACIEEFGPDRCMFESNFPVDRTGASYTVLWNAFKRIANRFAPDERRALVHDTAARTYRI